MELLQVEPHFCCMTDVVRDIFEACDIGISMRTLGVIVGKPGTGKTTAIEEFARQEQHARFIRLNGAKCSRAALLREMIQRMGIPASRFQEVGRFAHWENMDTLIGALTDGQLRLFIIDEAQKLERDAIEMIREIYDEALVSFMLVSNPEFGASLNIKNIEAAELSENVRMKFPQLSARISLTRWIGAPSHKDIKDLCSFFDIEGDDACRLVGEILSRHGHLHQIAPLIERARNQAGPNQPITIDHLKIAIYAGRNR